MEDMHTEKVTRRATHMNYRSSLREKEAADRTLFNQARASTASGITNQRNNWQEMNRMRH